ncbi:TolC family protein [Pontibacter beigongshangensis]|uniref:TolC family protein n=1 Tax=Pontibacter beigongshangensis TaxID=2574733 RepID=UPI00293BE4F8|nr:TolC family protein [Pontibacter beigongshangensis]
MIKRILTISLMLLLLKPAVAQETPLAKPLNLQEAINYALEHNEDVQKASYDELSAKYMIQEAKSNGLPQINGFGKLDVYPAIPVQVIPNVFEGKPDEMIAVQFGTKYNAQGGVQVSQLLFNKSYFVGLQAAKSTRDLYRLRKAMTEEEVIYNVSSAYFQILQTKEQFNTIDANLSRLEQLEKILALQYQNDLVKKVDVNRIKVNKTNLETQKQSLTSAVEQQMNLLKFFMGMPLEEPVELVNTQILLTGDGVTVATADRALQNQVQLQLLDKQKDLTSLQLENIKAGYYPSLQLSGSYLYSAMRKEFNLLDGNMPWFNTAVVGVQLNIPIFDGMRKHAQIRQTEITMKSLEEDRKKLAKNVVVTLENSINQLQNSSSAIQAQEGNVTLAQEVYDTTNKLYKEGISPLTDLLEAEVSLREAQTNLNNEVLKYKLAQLGYLKAAGELNTLTK